MSNVTIGILCSVISILLTFVITQSTTAKTIKKDFQTYVSEFMTNHEKQHHQIPTLTILEKHEQVCETTFRSGVKRDLKAIISGLSFVIIKQEGNPKDFGL